MTTRNLALFVHLVGVLALVAGITIAALTHHQARRADRAADVAVLLRTARAGVLLAAPGTLLLLPITSQLRRLLDDRISMFANLASSAAMLGVLWLMVAKPS